jgi:hypothetical protein
MSTVEATVQTVSASHPVSDRARAVIAQQRRLLKKFDSVSHLLGGVAAGMYLPGIDCTFDNPVRGLTGRRPLLVTLEVGEYGELSFTGSISRERDGLLNYSPIFNYDLTLPMTPKGGGKVLPANNVVLARRANELLAKLIAFARGLQDGASDSAGWLDILRLPTPLLDPSGRVYAEDYSAVLGMEIENPAANLGPVSVSLVNPAAKLFALHGVENAETLDQSQLDEFAAQWRAAFPVVVDDSVMYDAMLAPNQRVTLSLDLETAVEHAANSVVAAMRAVLPPKYQWAATYAELLEAAKNPTAKLRLSRLSAVQVFDVVDALDLPDGFSGYVLRKPEMLPVSSKLDPVE